MNKNIVLIQIIFSVLISNNATGQNFNKNFGRSYYYDEPNYLEIATDIELSDIGFYVFTYHQDHTILTSEVNWEGEELWWNSIGTIQDQFITGYYNHVDRCSDFGFVGAGAYNYYDTVNDVLSNRQLLVVRYDDNLDTIWTARTGDVFSFGHQAKECTNGDFVAVGLYNIQPGISSVFVARFNSIGDLIWSQYYDVEGYEEAHGMTIVETQSGNFIIGGTVYFDSDSNSHLLLKIDGSGNYIDHKVVGDNTSVLGWASVENVSDGNFVYCAGYYGNPRPAYFSKFDENLDTIWTVDYPITYFLGYSFSIKETSDGSFISTGGGYVNDQEEEEGVLVKISSEGELLWHRHYQNADSVFFYNQLFDVIQCPDGGYAACGMTLDVPLGQQYWVLKVDSMGCLVPGCDTLTSVFDLPNNAVGFEVYPNPAVDELNIYFESLNAHPKGQIKVYNCVGQMVNYFPVSSSGITYILNVQNLEDGFYILEYTDEENYRMVKKFMKVSR